MIKRRLFSTLMVFLFVFISVTFLVPFDLNAETREFWVDTSHWETNNVWVSEGHFQDTQEKRWVDTSYTVTRGYWENSTKNVWVSSGYTASRWVDTSHWEKQAYKVWVKSGYKASRWVDTSHYETRYRTVTKWVPCNKTFVLTIRSEPKNVILSKWWKYPGTYYYGTINGTRYKYWKSLYKVLPLNNIGQVGAWVTTKIKYHCTAMVSTYRESYRVWVTSGYKKYYWVDTSHWETQTSKRWVDTSYTVTQGYWENYTTSAWVDTSHYEYKAVWVEDGFYTSPLHGEVIVEKSPRYIFTRWHKDQNNEECNMELNVSWKVNNSNLSEGEEEKEIVRIYIYQDICRFNNKGVEKVIIFNSNVTPSVEGSINTITKFDYSGTEESILHIYLYARNGESAHVYFNNPINGFRSINLSSEGSNSDANTWLGGNNYGKFEF